MAELPERMTSKQNWAVWNGLLKVLFCIFETMCFGLTKPKWRKNTLPTVEARRWIHYAFGLCGSWGRRQYSVIVRQNGFHQISRNSRSYCSKVSQDIEVKARLGIPVRRWSKAYFKINHEAPPGKTDEGFGMDTTVPTLFLWICGELSNMPYMQGGQEYFWARGDPSGRMWKNSKSKNWKTLILLPREDLQSINWRYGSGGKSCRLAVGGLPVRSHPGRVEVSLSKTPNPQMFPMSWLVPCMAANRRWCVNGWMRDMNCTALWIKAIY